MRKIAVILLHFGYWAMYIFLLFIFFVLNAASQENFSADKIQFFIDWTELVSAFAIVPGIFGFYAGYYLLFRKYLVKRKIGLLFLSGFLVSIIGGIAGAMLLNVLKGSDIMFADGWNSAIPELITMCFIAAINCIVGLILQGFITAYSDIKWKEDLNKKNYEMELAMIKSQINPHFLFNTLNNIDALILKDQETASLYLNKLSDILRFMLYETKSERIPLAEELLFIEKYIELQKIRTANPNAIKLIVEGEVGDNTIPPLLFIPIIENAFTHTLLSRDGNSIYIYFMIDGNNIQFVCKNYFDKTLPKSKEVGGLGMELISKRLKLLYPDKHLLEIKNESDIYMVKLSIYENENSVHHN